MNTSHCLAGNKNLPSVQLPWLLASLQLWLGASIGYLLLLTGICLDLLHLYGLNLLPCAGTQLHCDPIGQWHVPAPPLPQVLKPITALGTRQ